MLILSHLPQIPLEGPLEPDLFVVELEADRLGVPSVLKWSRTVIGVDRIFM